MTIVPGRTFPWTNVTGYCTTPVVMVVPPLTGMGVSPVTVTGAAPASTVSQLPGTTPVALAREMVCGDKLPVMGPLVTVVLIQDADAGQVRAVMFPNMSSCGGVWAKV